MGSSKYAWSGPKEWRPPRPEKWLDSPLLSTETNKRVSLLFEKSGKGGSISAADATWLCETIKNLTYRAPDDYSFPEYLALINPFAGNAYALRFKERHPIECKSRFEGAARHTLLDHTTTNQLTDAVILIRPYIRLHRPMVDWSVISDFLSSEVLMTVDGERVLMTTVNDHLIFQDGSFSRKFPWKFVRRYPNQSFFTACLIDGENVADGANPQGIACPNATRIVVELSRSQPFSGVLALTTGLVAASYTTEGVPGERSNPRVIR